jgi:dihydrofolate reductase
MSEGMKPLLSCIAAVDENRLLADEHRLPWRLPRDVAHFRGYTRGKWLLLGRKTYDEMHGWFTEGRVPLVLTSRCGWDPEVGRVVFSVPHALALADSAGQAELVCIGGGQTFAAALPYAGRMLITTVHHRFAPSPSAVYFPAWHSADWREVQAEHFPKDHEHEWDFTIRVWERP